METRALMSGAEPMVLSGVLYILCYVELVMKAMSHMKGVEYDALIGLQSTGQYLEDRVKI